MLEQHHPPRRPVRRRLRPVVFLRGIQDHDRFDGLCICPVVVIDRDSEPTVYAEFFPLSGGRIELLGHPGPERDDSERQGAARRELDLGDGNCAPHIRLRIDLSHARSRTQDEEFIRATRVLG
jgi:hypothetical protein